jgi:hypothetical protein
MHSENVIIGSFRHLWLVPALTFGLLTASPAAAQATAEGGLLSNAPATGGGLILPTPNERGDLFGPAGLLGSTGLLGPSGLSGSTGLLGSSKPNYPAAPGQAILSLGARFGQDAPSITGGLIWRVFSGKPDSTGNFKLIREEKSATPTLTLPPGSYIVHVGFGLATAVKPVILRAETAHEEFDLPAGGLRIEGRVGDVSIPVGQISFEVYKGSQFETGDRDPISEHVMTGDVVIVPEGTYYIVSNYGDANSVVRSDIRVRAGKLTDIIVTHRAAAITLKLVAERGGEALANTAWSVLTPGGDVIKESIGAFPRFILAEGEYRAIARNDGKIYQRDFKVTTGVDGDFEVLAK